MAFPLASNGGEGPAHEELAIGLYGCGIHSVISVWVKTIKD
jgi:hypothetical protein